MHQQGGNRDQLGAQGGGGGAFEPVAGGLKRPAGKVVGEARQRQPGRIGGELARRDVREPPGFQVADVELDSGMLTMLGLEGFRRG